MGLTQLARNHVPAAVVLALAFAALSAVSVAGATGWVVLAALEVGTASTLGTLLPLFALGTVLGLPLTVAAAVVAAVGVAAHVSSVVTAKRRAASTRLGQVASRIERHPLARLLGVAALVEDIDTRSPERRADDRIERLKDRYVDGALSEWELEERTRIVLDEEGVPSRRPSGLDDRLRDAERS
ncbi:SHOCT domain-containing protein [Halosimplex pelagicum]|uniref:SHOCT domain-containing protein n=1 Tax=Halosimplex pelagicum TaxID=869886 RepID=A0A7D5TB39_9EURY|nr:SHOCT domain-containing protein [Halosimplex pelagicum]QLH81809.1 SHOCT domain-containing protein [Halosimplex pelagicum]